MAAKKTQQESEKAAKVYQLDAIQEQVSALKDQMSEGFNTVNSSVQALLVKSNSQVTPQQLADNITAVNKTTEEKIKEEVKKIHLTYGPIKDNNKWFIRAIIGQGIIILFMALFTLSITGKP